MQVTNPLGVSGNTSNHILPSGFTGPARLPQRGKRQRAHFPAARSAAPGLPPVRRACHRPTERNSDALWHGYFGPDTLQDMKICSLNLVILYPSPSSFENSRKFGVTSYKNIIIYINLLQCTNILSWIWRDYREIPTILNHIDTTSDEIEVKNATNCERVQKKLNKYK